MEQRFQRSTGISIRLAVVMLPVLLPAGCSEPPPAPMAMPAPVEKSPWEGTWTGKWDNTWKVEFKIGPADSRGTHNVQYSYQDDSDRPEMTVDGSWPADQLDSETLTSRVSGMRITFTMGKDPGVATAKGQFANNVKRTAKIKKTSG